METQVERAEVSYKGYLVAQRLGENAESSGLGKDRN